MEKQDKKKKYSIDLTSFIPVDRDEAWKRVNTRLSPGKPVKRRSILLPRLVAASIIVAVVTSVTYLFVSEKNKTTLVSDSFIEMPKIGIPNEITTITTEKGETFNVANDHTVVEKNGVVSAAEKTLYNPTAPTMITIEVPHGKIHKLTLSDGSVVTLNANSKLTFPSKFDANAREVKLVGEAFFEVQKSDVAFIVHYNYNSVKVLGTKFNVSAYPNSEIVTTTLVSGSVEMSTYCDAGVERQVLTPSEQYSYNIKKDDVSLYCVDVDYVTSWMGNVFEFKNMYLFEIVEQMERWYNINVFFFKEELRYLKFSGAAFKDKDANDLFKVLEQLADIKFQYTKDNIILVTN